MKTILGSSFILVFIAIFITALRVEKEDNIQPLIFKPTKNIKFSNTKWNLGFSLNIRQYFANNKSLKECISHLEAICNSTNEINNCKYFLNEIKNHQLTIQNDVKILQQFRKSKRFALQVAVIYAVAMGVNALLFALGIWLPTSEQEVIDKISENIEENRDTIKDFTTLYNDSTVIYKNVFNDFSNEINNLNEQIIKNKNKQSKKEDFNDVLAIANNLIKLKYHLKEITNPFQSWQLVKIF